MPNRVRVVVIVVGICFSARAISSQAPETPPPSSYAPADDLLRQADYFVDRVKESLADPDHFDLAKQSRTLKDANTLAALGFVLAGHDEDFPQKSSMPALVASAQQLATVEDDAVKAQQALSEIQAARAGKSPSAGAVPTKKVASLPALMKQVPLVHSGLRRGVRPGRLKRTAETSAGQAATLAAIAQAVRLDDEYAGSPQEAAQWAEYCDAMRDAAGEVNSAVHAQDQARVDAGMKRMLQSCEACHAKFRQQ